MVLVVELLVVEDGAELDEVEVEEAVDVPDEVVVVVSLGSPPPVQPAARPSDSTTLIAAAGRRGDRGWLTAGTYPAPRPSTTAAATRN